MDDQNKVTPLLKVENVAASRKNRVKSALLNNY